jgi:hypothetical protein
LGSSPISGTKPIPRSAEQSQFPDQRNKANSPISGTKPIPRSAEQRKRSERRD